MLKVPKSFTPIAISEVLKAYEKDKRAVWSRLYYLIEEGPPGVTNYRRVLELAQAEGYKCCMITLTLGDGSQAPRIEPPGFTVYWVDPLDPVDFS